MPPTTESNTPRWQPDDEPDVDARSRRPARRWTWVLAVLLLMLLASGGAYWRWGSTAERRLADRVEALRRAGEPVAPQDLVRPAVAGADNAAIDLRAAAALVDATSAEWQALGKVDWEEPLTPEDRRAVAAVVEFDAHRRALTLLRQARPKRGADWQMPMTSPLISTLLPDLGEQRNLAELTRLAIVHAEVTGDHAATVEHLRDVLTIARALEHQPMLISHLCAAGVGGMDTHLLGGLAPRLEIGGAASAPGGGPAIPQQVRALVDELLDEAALSEGLRQGLRGERVLQLDTCQLLADRRLPVNAVAGGGMAGLPPLPRAMILTDARVMLDYTTAIVAAVEASPDWPAFRQAAPPHPVAGQSRPWRHLVAGVLLPSFERTVKTHYQTVAGRRMAAVALALRWHMAEHDGKPPRTLDELVPKYLPFVPADPFAAGGKPLRYLPDPPHPLVYSLGENGTDEGGSRAPLNARRTGAPRWEQQDAVFSLEPKPAAAPDGQEQGTGE